MNRVHQNLLRILFIPLIILVFPSFIIKYEFPVYRFVLDPGHGGRQLNPTSKHGDRYDTISQSYLDYFKEGASYKKKIYEHEIVYSIAEKVETLLAYCAPDGDFEKFRPILKKYTDDEPNRIYIITNKSRKKSITDKQSLEMKDPNADYRVFDYPDSTGKIVPARISRINSYKPHMVLSIHSAWSSPPDYEGVTPILSPDYDFMYQGLRYLRGEHKSKKFFYNSAMNDWFAQGGGRTRFEWFLNDTALYYMSYPLNKNLTVDKKKFKGYRYNMIHWSYADDPGWEKTAAVHPANTKYSADYKNYKPEGRYWDRERTIYEKYKRSGGIEGYGGDNAYASYELIRYMMYSLNLRGLKHSNQKPGKSFFCVWIMPLHVNAVNPFLELGYFLKDRDRYLMVNKQDELAEGIAVGVYSLFAGMKIKDESFRYKPKGKKIDFEKYKISEKQSYFDVVTQ